MARGLNEVRLRGNLPRDPEVRYTDKGTAVLSMQLGVNEAYKDADDEWQERVQWIDFVAWGRNAEIIGEYAQKGSLIFIAGSLQKRQYEDERYTNEDGEAVVRYPMEVRVQRVDLLGGSGDGDGGGKSKKKTTKRSGGKKGSAKRNNTRNSGADFDPDDDLPF